MVSSGSPSALRRGLPRVAGGDAWPPAGIVPAGATPAPETGEVVDATATVAATPALASADGAASVSGHNLPPSGRQRLCLQRTR